MNERGKRRWGRKEYGNGRGREENIGEEEKRMGKERKIDLKRTEEYSIII